MLIDKFNSIIISLNLLNLVILHNAYILIINESRKADIERILAFSANFVCMSIVQLCINNLIVSFIVQFVTILWLALTYNEKLKDDIISVGILSSLLTFPDDIILKTINSTINELCAIISFRMLLFTISLVLCGLRKKALKTNINEYSCYFMATISVCSLIIQLLIIKENGIKDSITIGCLLIILINIIAYCLYESLSTFYVKATNIAILQRENELYSRQCEIMKKSTEELQAFRHDVNNQFIAMNELLSTNQIEAAKSQLQSLSSQIVSKNIYSYTGNIPIDSIINYKLQDAEKEQITINTHIAVPSNLNIEIVDIITILGNLLDNAIEAVLLLEENRIISLKLIYSQERLIISISNSFNGVVKTANGKLVTTKDNAISHGIGLSNVKKATEKYNGILKVNNSLSLFTVEILLFLCD